MQYDKLTANPKQFLALTGHTIEEFDNLLPHFKKRFDEALETMTLTGKPRVKRKHAAYKNSPLPTAEDNLLFILTYLKQGMTQENLAAQFGMRQPDANKRIHFLHPILNKALDDLNELPERKAENLDLEDKDEKFFLHDGSERPIVRPKDNEKQKLHFSGKKKTHSVKNIVLIDDSCKVIFLSDTSEGKKHDKKLADEANYANQFPEESVLLQDTGFQGFEAEKATIVQPKKKPRNSEFTKNEKKHNRKISKVRVRVEHAIGGVKRFRIVKDKIRNWKNGFRDMVMETCCGLHNFRLNFRPWTPVISWN